MSFNSSDFLIFFPIVVLIYFLIPQKLKNYWLLIASYYFYMCWNAKYALIILFSTIVTYLSGLALDTLQQRSADPLIMRKKKIVVAISVLLNLSLLFYFKYINFAIGILGDALSVFHIQLNLPSVDILLPVGISFYTFQALGYTIDVYRGDTCAEKNFFQYALFVSFFPQLVAGPIERSSHLLQQLATPHKFNSEEAKSGLLLMLWGFFLKIVLADRIAIFVDWVYGDYHTFGGWYLIVATALFAIQIYCDFAGYSIIAMGAAQILGIRLMENFQSPYLAVSVADFWRRWHISLTSWFREYLYIPLGGNRRGRTRQIWNLFVVWSLTGLWHGASWNFVLWGIYYFILLTIEKIFLGEKLEQLPGWLQHVYTCLVVLFGWVIFANENIADLGRYFLTMFGANGALYNQTAIYQWYTHIPLLIVLIIGSTKLPKQLLRKGWTRLKLIDAISSHQEQIRFVAASIFTVLVLYCSVAFLVSGSYNPFLYFRF